MNYYYERTEIELADFTTIIEWDIFNPNGERIAEATTEENANLIVTLMNHGQKTEEYQHGCPESPLP